MPITRLTILSVFLATSMAQTPTPVRAGERRVQDVVYDYAVTSYCGTLTPEVDAGFRMELADLTKSSGLDPEEAKAQRIAGWVAADMEWSNRGLGGNRAWCQSEGTDAARHFRSISRGGS